MKQFKFRLDRVLKLNVASRRTLEKDLSDIHSDLSVIGGQIDTLKKEIRTCVLSAGFNLVSNYRQHLRKQVATLKQKEDELCEVAAQVMELICVAKSKETGLEKLREKREQMFDMNERIKDRRNCE
jgi:flagellar biosynthesis chaperone FliJ